MSTGQYHPVESLDGLKILLEKLQAENAVTGFDLETGYTGPDREKGSIDVDWDNQFIVGFSITNGHKWARYVPVAHDYGNNLPEEAVWELMKEPLETLPIVAHNAKFEIRNLRALERKGRGPRINLNAVGDSMLDSYILSEHPTHGLKELVRRVFKHDMATFESLFPELAQNKKKFMRFNALELTQGVIDYACEDAAWCLALYDTLHPKVLAQRGFMWQLESKILYTLCDVEDAGLAVDWEAMREAYAYAEPFLEQMQDAARKMLGEMAGEDFTTADPDQGRKGPLNLSSSKQMQEVLYDKIGFSTNRTSKKTGKPSTDAIALEKLSREHPAVKKVLEVREVKNLRDRLKKWTTHYSQEHDARVHPSFNQVRGEDAFSDAQAPASGRFSAGDPSVQQLPKEWRWTVFPKVDPWKKEHWAQVIEKATFGKHYWQGNFRDFVIAAPGTYLLGFDYSQIELRCLAGMSGERSLMDAFNNDVDIHTVTAAMMLGKNIEDVDPDLDRPIGKTMNFALIYGMGAESLAERLALTMEEAEALYAQYFSAFTEVTGWMNEQKKKGTSVGYVETHLGRKVMLWDLQSSNSYIYSKGVRLCVNAPVQGTAADIMKIAMLRAQKALTKRGWWMSKVRMVNNIHDALVFEADDDIDPWELRNLLETAVVWSVDPKFPKIVADWELGHKWGSGMVKWGEEPTEFTDKWRVVKDKDAPAEEPDEDLTPEDFAEPAPEAVRKEEGKEVLIVEMIDTPERDAFMRFIDMLKEAPGSTVVTFRVPGKDVDLVKYPTSLTSEHQGRISLLLGGAKVYSPVEVIDSEDFTEGIEL